MGHVLVADDDTGIIETFRVLACAKGHCCTGASNGHDAIQIASTLSPELAFVDYELADLGGHRVVSAIRSQSPRTTCVMLTRSWNLEVEFTSKDSGAYACVRKPMTADDVIELLQRALQACRISKISNEDAVSTTLFLEAPQRHASARIIDKVIQFVGAAEDEATLDGFGRRVGISCGGFRNWCRTNALKPRAVLGFARALRAVCRRQLDPSMTSAELLKIVDARTLAKFQIASGGTKHQLPSTIDAFLAGQRFVQKDDFIAMARSALVASPALPSGRRPS